MSKKNLTVKEREEYIVELLKANRGDSVSGKTIETDTKMQASYRPSYMRRLMQKYPQIRNVSEAKKPAMYVWVDDSPVTKNHEGYPDPTMAEALNGHKEIPTPNAGETWRTLEANGTNGYIFVLNALNGAAQCIKLYQKTTENLEIVGPDPFEIRIKSMFYVGDVTHTTFKPLKYCVRCAMDRDDAKLMEARKRVAQVFGIKCFNPETKVVEKVVEKEVPVEKIVYKEREPQVPDGYVDHKTVEIALLTEQRDIWKQVALALMHK